MRHLPASQPVAACVALVLATCACGVGAAPPPAASVPVSTTSSMGTASLATELGLLPSSTEATPTTTVPALPAPPPAIPESRRLTLDYPATIRAGDSDVIRLTLEVDTLDGVTRTAAASGNLIGGGIVKIPNLYETHNVVAEADLDLAGADFEPRGPVSEPLLPGESVTFRWSVHPPAVGTYRGTAWLFLIFTDKVSGAQSREAISAQPVEIRALTLFGLGGDAARLAGGLGAVGGGVLGFPFADDLVRWLWKRIRGRA